MSRWNCLFGKPQASVLREGAQALSLFFMAALVGSAGCTPSSQSPQDPQAAVIARGRTLYAAHCMACHNSNPARPGALGPEVIGASLELLEARVLRASYPAGYTPKRKTAQMAKLPHLAPDLPALHAYLNSPSSP